MRWAKRRAAGTRKCWTSVSFKVGPEGSEGWGECRMGEEKEGESAGKAEKGQRYRRTPEGEGLYKLREEGRRGGAD